MNRSNVYYVLAGLFAGSLLVSFIATVPNWPFTFGIGFTGLYIFLADKFGAL